MKCKCEERAEVGAVTDHGWVPNVTPGADSWHKMVRHGADCCYVLTSLEVESLREVQAQEGHPEKGRKDDAEKPRYDLIPFAALAQAVGVLTYGAKKYAPENWRRVEGWRWRYLGAALRHVTKWAGGERIDPESGHPHLAHALCCLMFLAELDS